MQTRQQKRHQLRTRRGQTVTTPKSDWLRWRPEKKTRANVGVYLGGKGHSLQCGASCDIYSKPYFRIRMYSWWRVNPSAFAALDLLKRAVCSACSNHGALHGLASRRRRRPLNLRASGSSCELGDAIRRRRRWHRRRGDGQRQMLRRDEAAVAQNRRSLEDVPQFSNVSRPVVLDQQLPGVARNPAGGLPRPRPISSEKRLAERQDVIAAISQRRQPDREHVEPIIEIFAELPVGDPALKVTIRRSHNPGVGAKHSRSTEPLKFTLLEDAEELGLRRRTHLRDFVEKQRAAGGLFKLARLALRRPGVCASLVPEQFRFEQLLWKRGAIQRDERAVLRGDPRCRNRATTSLPVPDSPSSRTVVSVDATCVACVST